MKNQCQYCESGLEWQEYPKGRYILCRKGSSTPFALLQSRDEHMCVPDPDDGRSIQHITPDHELARHIVGLCGR